jgi:hypothetical protein
MGGARVRISSANPQEILLPTPQLADGQVPICYLISSNPQDAATDFRLRKREGDNIVVSVRLKGNRQEVQLSWSAVVLLAPSVITPDRTPSDPYRMESACVQSRADEIRKLAAEIRPKSGKAEEFAANIQRHIRGMKRLARPRSLDAVGIVKSGENGICTANANLASALMRSNGIACRSVSVIPVTAQRLEIHRIVEFFEDNRWLPFDPSSVHTDIPTKPWQNIIMAKTTIVDEQVAMKPRMGAAAGCPFGQEIELLTPGVNLFGQDFFWTIAKPLAEFEPSKEATHLVAEAWLRYLRTGTLSRGQCKASSATTAAEFLDSVKAK